MELICLTQKIFFLAVTLLFPIQVNISTMIGYPISYWGFVFLLVTVNFDL